MQSLNSIRRILMLAVPLAAPMTAGIVQAQEAAGNNVLPRTGAEQANAIRVRNLRVDLVAYWLDPQNNKVPTMFARYKDGKLDTSKIPAPPVAVTLPAGVERIVSVEPQNTLLVTGDAAGVAAVRTIVDTLDKPLRQFELELQLIHVQRADLKQLGFKDATIAKLAEDPSRVVTTIDLEGDWRAGLSKLQAGKKAQIVNAPRALVVRGTSFSLGTQVKTELRPELIPESNVVTSVFGSNLEGILSEVDRDLISIKLSYSGTAMPKSITSQAIQETRVDTQVSVTAQVHDGDTIALLNVPKSLLNSKEENKDGIAVILVTPRIVRRLTDPN